MSITNLSVTELADAIREKKISAYETVSAYIQRIQEINPKVNSIVQLRAEMALQEAEQLDKELAQGKIKGPLHGVPVTVKDTFDVADTIITRGTLGLKNNRAASDATVVKRLRNAGAIILGIANMPELALGADTDNLVYGLTHNPYNLDHSPGGSSGGGAASVAANMSALSIGSDMGGSLRIPAHYCGIATIRPTLGRIPSTGVPKSLIRTGLSARIATAGPLARKVNDLALVLPLISGTDGIDPLAINMPFGDMQEVSVNQLRIAYFDDNGVVSPDPDILKALNDCVLALQKNRIKPVKDKPKVISQGFNLMWELLGAEGLTNYDASFKSLGTTEISPIVKKLFHLFKEKTCDTATFMQRWSQWDVYQKELLQFMNNYDVLICPVMANVALPNDKCMWDEDVYPSISYCFMFSLTHFPCAVVRVGTSKDGLPIGIQIVAKPWQEHVALAVAHYLEKELGGWKPSNIFS